MFDVEKIREEFPILHREVYGKPLVYLDRVISFMLRWVLFLVEGVFLQ